MQSTNSTSANKAILKKIEKMPYEDAIKRLEEVVEILSSKQVNLDDMVGLYEEGNILYEHCDNLLKKAKMKVEEVK